MSANPVAAGIHGTKLTKTFDGRILFENIDIRIIPGEITGVVGASGTGKTMLLRILTGLTPPTAGTVTYDGAAASRVGGLGILAQHPRQVCNPRWTVRRIIAEPAAIVRRDIDLAGILERVGLDATLLDRFPAQVSDGQLQRACLARILVAAPDYVLCDEPTAMLDPVSARRVIGVLADLVDAGTGALLVTHNHRLAQARSTRVVDLGAVRGRTAQSAPIASRSS